MNEQQLKNILEAILMSSGKALSADKLCQHFVDDEPKPSITDIKKQLKQLQEDYAGRGIELNEVSTGYRFQAVNEYGPWVSKLWEERPQRYSRALLETLALIAYKQPVTRSDIEDVRGVSVSSSIIKTLLEREWVRVVGHRDVPGRPALYATTRQFLDYFNLKSLDQLPSLSEIKDLSELDPELDLGEESSVASADTPEQPDEQNKQEQEQQEQEQQADESVAEPSNS
jgi:segregation and condensation protein B